MGIRTLTTTEAAGLLGIRPGSLRKWARRRGVQPLHTVRIGRSSVTVWDPLALGRASAR